MAFPELKHTFVGGHITLSNVMQSSLTIALQELFSLLPRVSQAVKVEGKILQKTTLTSNTVYKLGGVPKTYLYFDNL